MSAPGEKEPDADTRVTPDPFAVVLPSLAALGAIASIAAINWSGQDKTPDRSKAKRKPGTALRDLEGCCLNLVELFRRFNRHPTLFSGSGASATSPMKFGVHGGRMPADIARIYQQLVNDVASILVQASQNSFDVMCAIEDGEVNPPEELFFGFGEQQEQLNKLIQTRANLKACIETGGAVAQRLLELARELKRHRAE